MRRAGIISHSTMMHFYQLSSLTMQFGLFASFGYQRFYFLLTTATLVLSWGSYAVFSLFYQDAAAAAAEPALAARLDALAAKALGAVLSKSALRLLAGADTDSPAGLAVWLLAVPFGVHALIMLLFGLDADSSGGILFGVVLSAGMTGFFLAKTGFGLHSAALASALPPAVFAWSHLYWTLDMHSPGGAAQWLVECVGWRGAPATLAVAAVAAAFAAAGWLLMRFDGWRQKRTGRSLFDGDD
jgi:hypothetical protein